MNTLTLLQDLPFSLARIVISAGNIHECILGGREASSPDLRGLSLPSLTFNGFKAWRLTRKSILQDAILTRYSFLQYSAGISQWANVKVQIVEKQVWYNTPSATLIQSGGFMHGPMLSDELTLKGTCPVQVGESEQRRQQLPPKQEAFFQTWTASHYRRSNLIGRYWRKSFRMHKKC